MIKITDGQLNTGKFITELKDKIMKNSDIVGIYAESNNYLKIVGFRHNDIKIEISYIIEKAKAYNFPTSWEDTMELVTSDDQVMIKNVAQGTDEWKQ